MSPTSNQHFLKHGLRGYTFSSCLKPGDRFQYVNVLNYLRSRFPFIDIAKQLFVFMFEVLDDTDVAMLYFWVERQV